MAGGERVCTGNPFSEWETVERVLDVLFDREPDLFFWQEFQRKYPITREQAEEQFHCWSSCSVREFTDRISPDGIQAALVSLSPNPGFDQADCTSPVRVVRTGDSLNTDTLYYDILETVFGSALLSGTEEGLVQLEFISSMVRDEHLQYIKSEFPNTQLIPGSLPYFPQAQEVINRSPGAPFEGERPPRNTPSIPILLLGSPFQLKVWEQLLMVGEGQLITYGELAEWSGGSQKARAVGRAVGANRLAYLVPCHRVIGKEGVIGNFRWGTTRKKAMIGRERCRPCS